MASGGAPQANASVLLTVVFLLVPLACVSASEILTTQMVFIDNFVDNGTVFVNCTSETAVIEARVLQPNDRLDMRFSNKTLPGTYIQCYFKQVDESGSMVAQKQFTLWQQFQRNMCLTDEVIVSRCNTCRWIVQEDGFYFGPVDPFPCQSW